jgi:hypothetical protein
MPEARAGCAPIVISGILCFKDSARLNDRTNTKEGFVAVEMLADCVPDGKSTGAKVSGC